MDEPRGYYAKGNKSEKDKYHMISIEYGIISRTVLKPWLQAAYLPRAPEVDLHLW